VTTINLPSGGTNLLKTRIANARATLGTLGLSNADFTLITNAINSIDSKLFSYKVQDTLAASNPDESLPPFNATFSKVVLNSDKIIYLPSDESTHVFLDSREENVYIVDAGTPILVNGISTLI